jgi:hypothetical protein
MAMQFLSYGLEMLVVAHSFQLSALIETTNIVAFRSAPRLCGGGYPVALRMLIYPFIL